MPKQSYDEWLKADLGELIDDLEVGERRRRYLKSRWLDQVAWLGAKAGQARTRYYALRLVTVVGAVLVPALVALNPSDDTLDDAVRVATWSISLVVAIAAAVEQFFHYGDRWRNYRRTSERLKTEGWLYFQLGGRYGADGATHAAAYPEFATRVEELIQGDVDAYLALVAAEKANEKEKGKKQKDGDRPARREEPPEPR